MISTETEGITKQYKLTFHNIIGSFNVHSHKRAMDSMGFKQMTLPLECSSECVYYFIQLSLFIYFKLKLMH